MQIHPRLSELRPALAGRITALSLRFIEVVKHILIANMFERFNLNIIRLSGKAVGANSDNNGNNGNNQRHEIELEG